MIKSDSNIGSGVYLLVDIFDPLQDGDQPMLSIGLPGFPNAGVAVLHSDDQQLIGLEDIIRDFADSRGGDKYVMAAFFERMAGLLRAAAARDEARRS